MYKTPILLILFNRPSETQTLFDVIKRIKPSKLYVSIDGPRNERDAELSREVKAVISPDWECQLQFKENPKNLGCGIAPQSAISWVFEHEEKAIILEDDCIPSDSYFTYCSSLLDYYSHDESVCQISGCNFQNQTIGDGSYYFSSHPHTWGWGTWRRAWQHYDFHLTDLTISQFKRMMKNRFGLIQRWRWYDIFRYIKKGKPDYWDFQWYFTCLSKNWKAVVPNTNLIENIGFNENGTHTMNKEDYRFTLERGEIGEISHPSEVDVSEIADRNEAAILWDNHALKIIIKHFVRFIVHGYKF